MSEAPSYAAVVASDGASNSADDSSSNESNVKHTKTDAEPAIEEPESKPYAVAIKTQPVTEQRKPHVPKEDDALVDPGTARANIVPTNEAPHGTTERNWAEQHENQTAVVQHVDYWDTDHDGIIWPQDTYVGFRKWGWSLPLALYGTFLINVFLSYPTCPGLLPDPFFRIWTARLYKDKHGSDSMSYDNEGRFRPQNFEDFFAKYDQGNKGGLDVWDLLRAQKGQRMVFDFFGWTAAFFEWLAVYLLLWPEDGILRKEDVRGVFDGSIFEKKAEEYEQKKAGKTKQKKLQ